MLDWAEYTKFFLALPVIVNPIGAVPLFVSMTAQNNEDEKRHIARVVPFFLQAPDLCSKLKQLLAWRPDGQNAH